MLENLCHCIQYSRLVGSHLEKSHLDSLVIVPFFGLSIMWAAQPALGEAVVVAVAPAVGSSKTLISANEDLREVFVQGVCLRVRGGGVVDESSDCAHVKLL